MPLVCPTPSPFSGQVPLQARLPPPSAAAVTTSTSLSHPAMFAVAVKEHKARELQHKQHIGQPEPGLKPTCQALTSAVHCHRLWQTVCFSICVALSLSVSLVSRGAAVECGREQRGGHGRRQQPTGRGAAQPEEDRARHEAGTAAVGSAHQVACAFTRTHTLRQSCGHKRADTNSLGAHSVVCLGTVAGRWTVGWRCTAG